MLGKDHQLTSVGIMGMVTLAAGLQHPIMIAVGTAIGALLPDLDSPTSTISRHTTKLFAKLFKHRGFLHSLYGWLVFCILMWLIFRRPTLHWLYPFCFGADAGYLLHLLEDSFSREGTPLLGLSTRSNRHGYKVGGFGERVFAMVVFIVGFWCLLEAITNPSSS